MLKRRRALLLSGLFLLFLPSYLCGYDKKEIDIIFQRGYEYQNKAFQSGAEGKKRYIGKAIGEYEKIIYLAPDEEKGYLYAGLCYEHLSEFSKAIEIYSKGVERLKSQKQKMLFLDGIARCNTNAGNFKAVEKVIEQMEKLQPNSLEAAWACSGIATSGSDVRMKEVYYKRGLKICDYILKNSADKEARQSASRIRDGMLSHYGYKTPEPDPAANIQYDVWEKNILSLAGNKDYEKVVRVHQEILKRSLNMDPLSKGYFNPVPMYMSYLEALLESYAKTNRWEDFFEITARLFNRRMEIKDDPYGGRPVYTILPYLTRFLKIYLSAQNKKFYFKKPNKALLIPELWLYEVKDDALFSASFNDSPDPVSDDEILALGYWDKKGKPYRILLRFSVPQALQQFKIERAEISLFREHKHISRGDCIPVLYSVNSLPDQESLSDRQGLWKKLPAGFSQKGMLLPDADSLVRRDIGRFQGGYVMAQLYLFDITKFVKAWHKKDNSNEGFLITLNDEKTSAFRGFWSGAGLYPPKVNIVIRSNKKPELDDIIKYQEDWISYYVRGLNYLNKGGIRETEVLWEKAKEVSGDKVIKNHIEAHIALLRDLK